MEIKNAKFVTSMAQYGRFTGIGLPQIAVAGKSNVGKSSLINALCRNGKLAKTSGTPGKTRLLNVFEINGGTGDAFHLVDLPGYGFAKVDKSEKLRWGEMMQGYFDQTRELRIVLQLVDIRHDPMAILAVSDLAWDGRAGLQAILGFLGRFTADYGTVRMYLPVCLDLLSILQSPQAYDVRETAVQGYMIRPVNVQKLLEVMHKPAGAEFVIRVEGDGQIPENNGTWAVTLEAAAETDAAPDLTVSVQALGQLAAGSVSLAEAVYRPDVTVSRNREVLEQVFRRKPVLVQDHF